jgi:hypothetical protein
MKPSAEARKRKKRLIELCRELPRAEARPVGMKQEHLQLQVRGKTFGYYSVRPSR